MAFPQHNPLKKKIKNSSDQQSQFHKASENIKEGIECDAFDEMQWIRGI